MYLSDWQQFFSSRRIRNCILPQNHQPLKLSPSFVHGPDLPEITAASGSASQVQSADPPIVVFFSASHPLTAAPSPKLTDPSRNISFPIFYTPPNSGFLQPGRRAPKKKYRRRRKCTSSSATSSHDQKKSKVKRPPARSGLSWFKKRVAVLALCAVVIVVSVQWPFITPLRTEGTAVLWQQTIESFLDCWRVG